MGKQLQIAGEEKRESIVINNQFLANKTIFMAMGDLLKGYYGHDTAFQLEKFSRRLNQAQKKFADDSEAVIKKYTKLGKNGQPMRKIEQAKNEQGEGIVNADGTPKMIPVDFDWNDITEKNDAGEDVTTSGKELAEIEFMNLGEVETTIDVYKFPRRVFDSAKLTVAQWMALNPILADPYTDLEE